MEFAYYPGCSLTGSAKQFDKGIRRVFSILGHTLKDIPEWNCCGAFEYGNRQELVRLSGENLKKADGISRDILAPCPACSKNLKEANKDGIYKVYNSIELLSRKSLSGINIKHDLTGQIFTPYYGCILLRPRETAIPDCNIMEDFITGAGGDIAGEKIKDRCCGGSQFFINKWLTERLSRIILERSRGIIIVFCPLCHMALTTFSEKQRIIYLTDLILYVAGETSTL